MDTIEATVGGGLQRNLRNRHIQLIALGGTIGVGLFLGSAGTLRMAGPSMLLGYAIVGAMAFMIMRFLGEMLVENPVSHSFSHFAHCYWSKFAGFFSGWNAIALYALAAMLELSAAGKFMQFWWPELPAWVTAAAAWALLNTLNAINVRIYGETEFWFALIKVVAITAMIAFGGYLLVVNYGRPGVGLSNLWAYGGFFPHGVGGMVSALGVIAISFVGIEIIGYAAAEARDPEKVIPKATRQIVYRVLLFYVGSGFVLLTIFPWPELLQRLQAGGDAYSGSPFALVFAALGDKAVANILNLVIVSATLSAYNSVVYSSSRMLCGIARQGHAPKALARINRQGIPGPALALSAMLSGLCVILNLVLAEQVITLLISLITTAALLMWVAIIWTHLRFRRHTRRQGGRAAYAAPASPWSNWLCLALVVAVGVALFFDPQSRTSIYAIPLWVGGLWLIHRALRRRLRAMATSSRAADISLRASQ